MRKTNLLLIPLVMLALGSAAPLTDSQKTRLDATADNLPTIDEAGLYALLENASKWTSGDAGATIPDYDAMRKSPSDWRGKLCLIEGRLLSELPPMSLAREGWDHVRGFVIQIGGFDKSTTALTADEMAIVYLTDPPQTQKAILELSPGLLKETGDKVRLVARFFKISTDKNTQGKTRHYVCFVGHAMAITGGSSGGASAYTVPIVLAVLIFAGGIIMVRLMRKSGGLFAKPNRMAEYMAQKRAERKQSDEATEEDEDDDTANLPEDPADALNTLAERRRNRPNDNPLDE